MTCEICTKLNEARSAALDACAGKPAGAPEYREARLAMAAYHRHFDSKHRPGGRYIQPKLTGPILGKPALKTCPYCGHEFYGRKDAPACNSERCQKLHEADRKQNDRRKRRAKRLHQAQAIGAGMEAHR